MFLAIVCIGSGTSAHNQTVRIVGGCKGFWPIGRQEQMGLLIRGLAVEFWLGQWLK